MNSSPYISVVIPTCRRPELVLRCITSILQGSYAAFEIVVIDQDAARTLERELSQHFPGESRLKYLFLEGAGASRARNFGIERARGDIVAFIDDDAAADPGWLRAIAELFTETQPAPALMGGRIDPLWAAQRPLWYPAECEYLLGLYNIGDDIQPMPEHHQPIGANMAGRRDIIMTLGGFDEHLGPNYFRKRPMVTGEEAILGQRARKAGFAVYYQPQARVQHQISKTKLTRRYFLRRHFWEGVTVITEMQHLGDLGATRRGHMMYHGKQIVKSFVLALFPFLRARPGMSNAQIRMLALSRLAFSAGVIYALATMKSLPTD